MDDFFNSELSRWPLAAINFNALEKNQAVPINENEADHLSCRWKIHKRLANHRRASITAKTDPQSISERPCFLCAENRPSEQGSMRQGDYDILVNPYPLARRHFTIASIRHEPQRLSGHIREMATLCVEAKDLCLFYNGPHCGASAPDHLHFQAVSLEIAENILSIDHDSVNLLSITKTEESANIYRSAPGIYPFPFFIIDTNDIASLEHSIETVMNALPESSPEPMVNVAIVNLDNGSIRTFIAPRRRHRPACYEKGDLLVSPASIEMLGTIVCSRQEDFDRIDERTAYRILSEVALSDDEFNRTVSILYDLNNRR